jgi:carbon storage regulator
MLVLSRKVGEKIMIGDNITIVVQRLGKGRVALAIDAPHEIPVLRGELAPFGVAPEPTLEPGRTAERSPAVDSRAAASAATPGESEPAGRESAARRERPKTERAGRGLAQGLLSLTPRALLGG